MKTLAYWSDLVSEIRLAVANAPEFSNRKISFQRESFIVRCDYARDDLEALATRLEKFETAPGYNPQRFGYLNSQWSQTTFNEFCKDGELANAVSYSDNAGKPVYFALTREPGELLNANILVKAKEFKPGWVVAQYYQNGKLSEWGVTHLESGKNAGMTGKNAKQAIENHKLTIDRLSEGELDKILESQSVSNYQNTLREAILNDH